MPIQEEFRKSILSFARDSYSPGEEDPLSHGMVENEEDGSTVFAFTCDVDPAARMHLIQDHCAKPGAVAAAHAFESFGISADDKTRENLMKYGPRYENWPDHLRKEAVNVVIESHDGDCEYWQATIENEELGEFELGSKATGRMMGFFPEAA
jgi:hypothetical protein